MARIRTIKPELPHDAKLASLSRDCRYTFVLLFTIADDRGLLRGNRRYLVGALYPHDPDVTEEILSEWLARLTSAGFLRSSVLSDGEEIIHIVNWTKHQKIDRPSKSWLHEHMERDKKRARE